MVKLTRIILLNAKGTIKKIISPIHNANILFGDVNSYYRIYSLIISLRPKLFLWIGHNPISISESKYISKVPSPTLRAERWFWCRISEWRKISWVLITAQSISCATTKQYVFRWNIYIYIYISSCRAASTDIPDPLSPLFPIVHCLWQVFRSTSRILT